jgi:hypothetical protein
VVEGTPLLREHAGKNSHRRFESVRLRQFSITINALSTDPQFTHLSTLLQADLAHLL